MECINKLLEEMEKLLMPSGAFIAAPVSDYQACWLRDQLNCSLCYYYLSDFQKLKKGIWVVFNILHRYRWKIDKAISNPPSNADEYLHAKYNPDTFEEITKIWGHHQLDALGLFLYLVAKFQSKKIKIIRNKRDLEIIQLLIFYLRSVRYWEKPDNGMWEDDLIPHASSIGAVVAGLSLLKRRKLVTVPESMIVMGRKSLNNLLPNESPNQEVNMAQLSLIWPYNIVSWEMANIILERIKEKLTQKYGLNRYLGDDFYRSKDGVSGEWPTGFFWVSITESQRGNFKEAQCWFDRGVAQMTKEGYIPELYKDGKPNEHTPLAEAHSLAIIAGIKLKKAV